MTRQQTAKPRMLIFSTAYFPFWGGVEVSVREITKRLADDYEFDLITARMRPDLPRFERIGAVNVYRVGFGFALVDKLLVPFWGAVRALVLARRHPYALFWAQMVTFASGAAYLANLLRFWRPVPIVLTLQEGDSEEHIRRKRAGLIGLSWRLALARATLVTVLSSYLKERARVHGYRGPVVIVPNAVDTAHFAKRAPADAIAAVKRELGKHEGDVFLITISRLVEKNAVDDIITALTFLPEHVSCIVAGVGPDEQKLRALVAREGLGERVFFIGWQDHDWIMPYLNAADIFVRPSRSEGFGISFIEAMAAGLPVIATKEGGIADFLFDERRDPERESTGWAVDKDSPEQIAQAVERILADPEKTHTVVARAQTMARERYDWDLIAAQMRTEVFASLLEKDSEQEQER